MRVYEQQGNGDWSEAAALTEDDLCPGGADINTGWRYVECLEKNR